MGFTDVARDMTTALFAEFGEDATYSDGTTSKSVRVVIDKNAEQFGAFDTSGPVRRHELSFLAAEITAPKRGHTITTSAGEVFTLDGSIDGDGIASRWHINAN